MRRLSAAAGFISKVISSWSDDGVSLFAAALAYYATFSIAPLVLISVSIAGLLFGVSSSSERVFDTLQALIGSSSTEAIRSVVSSASHSRGAGVATLAGLGTLLLGATGFFTQLRSSLNIIWRVRAKPSRGLGGDLLGIVKESLFSIGMLLGSALLLLASLAISAAAAALKFFTVPAVGASTFSHLQGEVALLLSFSALTLSFASVFKVLPGVSLRWRDVWPGAMVAAALFEGGKLGISFYIRKSALGSTFGAAGSLVIVLLWVFYSSCILFFGAEWVKVQFRYKRKDRDKVAPLKKGMVSTAA